MDFPMKTVWARDLREGQKPGKDWRPFIRDGYNVRGRPDLLYSVIVAWEVPDPDWYISQLGDA